MKKYIGTGIAIGFFTAGILAMAAMAIKQIKRNKKSEKLIKRTERILALTDRVLLSPTNDDLTEQEMNDLLNWLENEGINTINEEL